MIFEDSNELTLDCYLFENHWKSVWNWQTDSWWWPYKKLWYCKNYNI